MSESKLGQCNSMVCECFKATLLCGRKFEGQIFIRVFQYSSETKSTLPLKVWSFQGSFASVAGDVARDIAITPMRPVCHCNCRFSSSIYSPSPSFSSHISHRRPSFSLPTINTNRDEHMLIYHRSKATEERIGLPQQCFDEEDRGYDGKYTA